MEDKLMHMLDRSRGYNVYCSNGSAHAKRTEVIALVTCPKCRERMGLTNKTINGSNKMQ